MVQPARKFGLSGIELAFVRKRLKLIKGSHDMYMYMHLNAGGCKKSSAIPA